MTRIAGALVGIFAAVAASHATVACPPLWEIKRIHAVSELQLSTRPIKPAVVCAAGNYGVYIEPQEFIEAIRGRSAGEFEVDAFLNRLQSLLSLDSDIDVQKILTAIAPEAPERGERTDRARRHLRFWRHAKQQLSVTIAGLLEEGRAAVLEISSGKAVGIKLDKYSDGCMVRERKFIAPDGIVILQAPW
jgi:hypothetical protein